jgi:membrane protease YdiL (CAAX protease family)
LYDQSPSAAGRLFLLSAYPAEACKFTHLSLKSMYDRDSRGISYTAGFFMLICFAIAGLILASLVGAQLWLHYTGKPVTDMEQGLADPSYSNVMKIIQSLTAIVGFLIPTIFTAAFLSRRPFRLLGFPVDGIRINHIVLVIFIIGASLMVSSSLSFFTSSLPIPDYWKVRFDKMEMEYNNQVTAIIGLKDLKDYILALVIMAFLPALCEETLFRGGLQNFLTRGIRHAWISIVIVSIMFSLAHFSFYGFLSRFFLGLVLGALYHYSGKLWLSVLAHFLNNALAITVLYISTQQGKPLPEAIKQDATSFWGILALPVVLILFVAFRRASDRRDMV